VAFVPVGQNPNLKKIFKDILYDLDKRIFCNIHNTEKDERILIDELREFLVDKRYASSPCMPSISLKGASDGKLIPLHQARPS
jgi:hypothetical protein